VREGGVGGVVARRQCPEGREPPRGLIEHESPRHLGAFLLFLVDSRAADDQQPPVREPLQERPLEEEVAVDARPVLVGRPRAGELGSLGLILPADEGEELALLRRAYGGPNRPTPGFPSSCVPLALRSASRSRVAEKAAAGGRYFRESAPSSSTPRRTAFTEAAKASDSSPESVTWTTFSTPAAPRTTGTPT